MIQISGLDLTNVVTFKKLSVDFTNNVTYVRGLNLDSDPANPTSNGAGKSLMFSTLANILFRSVPTSSKKNSKKDILRQKGSSVGLIIRPHEDAPEYEIIQTSTGYKIYEDGKDLEMRTVPIAEEFIRKLFPMPEIKFYATQYLSTQRPYLLQKDTDSNRLQHLTDIFNLDQYSAIREVLAVKARAIKDNEVKLSVLEQRLVTLKRKSEDVKSTITKAEYVAAKKQYAAQTKQLEQLQNKKFELVAIQRALDSLLKIETTLDTLRSSYKFKLPPAEMRKKLKVELSAARAWSDWDSSSSHATKLRADVKKKLDALDLPKESKSKCEKALGITQEKLETVDAKISELKGVKRQYESLTEQISEISSELEGLGIDRADIPKGDLESEISVLRSTLRLEKLLHKHDADFECPTCLSKLEVADLERTVKAAKKKLPKLEAFEVAKKLFTELDKLSKEAVEFDEAAYNKLIQRKKNLEDQVESLESALSVHKKAETLLSTLDGIEIPEKPDVVRPSDSEEHLIESIELCTKILESLASKATALENHPEFSDLRSVKSVKSSIRKHEASLEELDTQIAEVRQAQSTTADSISAYQHFENTVAVYSKERADAEADIEKLKPGMSDKKILDILLKAYGAKGLRSKAADSVCKLLEVNLNHYRDLIFAEPFIFEVNSSESGVSILVDRNNGKPDSVSDVRHLSGAESNAFQLLCMISLLPLIPTNERTNMCILDEPTSHMCQVSSSLFNERFLPVLREVVPNVFIITPHEYDTCPNSAEWLIQKQGGVSTLKV